MMFSTRTGLCNRILATEWRRVGRRVVVGSTSLVSVFALLGFAGLRVNTTPSLPIGIYVQTGTRSPLVEFCPSGEPAAIAARRGYRSAGNCPDDASALLKPIVAKSGDVVDFGAFGLSVNGHAIQNTAPLSVDADRRPLEHFPYGRYVVGTEEVWVASSYNKRSFDSRYYGPISIRAIRAHLRPLLTL